MKKKEIKPYDNKYVSEKKKMKRKKRIRVTKLQGEILEFRDNTQVSIHNIKHDNLYIQKCSYEIMYKFVLTITWSRYGKHPLGSHNIWNYDP